MPWSGGTYTRNNGTYSGSTVWQSDAAAAVKIRADRHDTHDQDIATGINNCLTKDGQNSPTQNISWGNFKITSLANGTAATDAAAYGQTITALAWSGATITGTRSAGNLTIAVTAANINSSLGYTPANKAGDTFTGTVSTPTLLTSAISPTGGAGSSGLQVVWNVLSVGTGRTEIINNNGGGAGGWAWYDRANTSIPAAAPVMTLDASGNVVAVGGITVGGGRKLSQVTVSSSAPGALADGVLYLRY